MTVTEEAIAAYKPLTSETRVEDFAVPSHLHLGGSLIELPNSIIQKDVHFLINKDGLPVRAAWISQTLAHILNSFRFEDPDIRTSELNKALTAVETSISNIIKYGVLKDKHGPGAMAFCQANENVPKDSIVISARTFDTLCLKNPKWKYAKTVMAVRFPNLGPGTTQELKLIVNKVEGLNLLLDNLPSNSIGNRISNLGDFLKTLEDTTTPDTIDTTGIVDAFYLHPETLKDGFEGDSDGDQIFIVLEKKGQTTFKYIDMHREAGEIPQSDVDMLFAKADRLDRTNLKTWLPPYFDDVPIGPATYAIRWMLYHQVKRFRNTDHPMANAWEVVAPYAIQIIEFVMDIRKGEWTEKEIEFKMQNIQNKMSEIRKAKEAGDWFARTVTSSSIAEIPQFIMKFKTLQDYVNSITMQHTNKLEVF